MKDSIGKVRIQPRSLREVIVDHLEHAIISGIYPPGQRLVERELISQFGVSSIPVREALQELENRGLVVKRHNHGCSVVELTPEEARRIEEFRRVLEPKVVEWAAHRITPVQVRRLEYHLKRMAQAAARRDVPTFFHEDLQFHKCIWDISQNTYAAKALQTAVGSLFAAGLMGVRVQSGINLQDEVKKHLRLLRALEAGDAKLASRTLSEIARGFEGNVKP